MPVSGTLAFSVNCAAFYAHTAVPYVALRVMHIISCKTRAASHTIAPF